MDPLITNSRRLKTSLGLAFLLLTFTAFLSAKAILHVQTPSTIVSSPIFLEKVIHWRLIVLQWGTWLSALLLAEPAVASLTKICRPQNLAVPLQLCLCLFFAWFIFHFGNHQFGAWDLSNAIDTGWRQVLGQRPYTDFISPNPPGFNFGMYYAFEIFGVSWNADLYVISIFTVLAFLWIGWLLRRLELGAGPALFISSVMVSVTVLPLCFWWYNNTTPLLASIFLLSTLLYTRHQKSFTAAFSYVISLSILLLMKPNIAGLYAVGATFIVLVLLKKRGRILSMTLLACGIAITLLAFHHISIRDLLASYRSIAVERGGLTLFGLNEIPRKQRIVLLFWALAIAAPLVSVPQLVYEAMQTHDRRTLAFSLLLALTLPLMLYGIATNVDLKDIETPGAIAACGVITFGMRRTRPWLEAFFIACLCSMVASDLYFGAERLRIRGIGLKQFFEYTDANQPVHDPFFSDLHATKYLDEVQQEVRQAATTMPEPIFMGPRLEFEYADLRLASPRGWPVYYQPGTSFARTQETALIRFWEAQRFETLIFLGPDRTFYPPELLDVIARNYRRISGYKEIQVYERNSVVDQP